MTPALGRDINEFYNHHFPKYGKLRDVGDSYYIWLEDYLTNDGLLHLPSNEEFDLREFGDIYYLYTSSAIGTFEERFNLWMQTRPQTITIEVAQDDYSDTLAQLKKLGFKVITERD